MLHLSPIIALNKSTLSCCVEIVAGCENQIPMITHICFSKLCCLWHVGGGGGGGHLMAEW